MRKILLIIMTSLILVGCGMKTIYFHYNHTQIQGWEKNDTLTYDISPVTHQGVYATTIGLRINGSYPFTSIALIVEKTILPRHEVKTDTIRCLFTDKNGNSHRQGTSYFQYTTPAGYLHLLENDSVHITIRHCMKRDILPGISDVGIKVDR